MGKLALAVGRGNGEAISQTEDLYYLCNSHCLTGAIFENVSRKWAHRCDTVSVWAGDPILYTNGKPTGDVTTWEIISADNESSCHEYCWSCGDLVVHGIDDDYNCFNGECDAPEYVVVR